MSGSSVDDAVHGTQQNARPLVVERDDHAGGRQIVIVSDIGTSRRDSYLM